MLVDLYILKNATSVLTSLCQVQGHHSDFSMLRMTIAHYY